ncbi:NAD-dependent deacylase [Aestuariimicrobium sp. Y1814]|uniref:NAD-dependent deacylase n=1 Tax=Aestuariimicrobium sp. Y1814 TaxID=3418742 RepID=UPI003DA76A41
MTNLVVLTGAGISAESGLATFRASDGLWENHRIEDVATPEGFARNPDLVHRFYDGRRAQAATVEPNPAHQALARLETSVTAAGGRFTLITQNIDDLHERAGSYRVLHMHGELNSALCSTCGARTPWTGPLGDHPNCPVCHDPALRPDVVWFGEVPYHLDRIERVLDDCDLFVVIGTSGVVYPAAGLASLARAAGARTILLNLEEQEGWVRYDEVRLGPATEVVPQFVADVTSRPDW